MESYIATLEKRLHNKPSSPSNQYDHVWAKADVIETMEVENETVNTGQEYMSEWKEVIN